MDHQPYNEMADIFSLGIIFWELLERQIPYDEYDFRFASQLEVEIVKGLRPTVRKSFQDHSFGKLIKDCFLGNPANRPTASSVLRRLKEIKWS